MIIEVLTIGSEVFIDGEIPALVKRICIEDEACCISYECVWWDERNRRAEWLRSSEVKTKDGQKTHQIRFK